MQARGNRHAWPLILIGRCSISTLPGGRKDNIIDLASRDRPGRRRLVKELFDRHARALRLFLLGRAVPHDRVEDLLQELFARLMEVERLEQKMSDATGSNRSYLLTMANNLIVDRQRRLRVRADYAAAQREIASEQMDEHTPERIVAAQLELEAIKAVIRNMRLNWRVALVLQRFRNMSYAEIALHMGVTEKQVENYIVRAMRRVRKARRKIKAAGERSC